MQGFGEVIWQLLNLALSVQNAPVALELHQKCVACDEFNQLDFSLRLQSNKIKCSPRNMRFYNKCFLDLLIIKLIFCFVLHIDHLTEASIIANNIKSFPPGNGITILEFPDVVTSEIDRDFIDCYRVLGH